MRDQEYLCVVRTHELNAIRIAGKSNDFHEMSYTGTHTNDFTKTFKLDDLISMFFFSHMTMTGLNHYVFIEFLSNKSWLPLCSMTLWYQSFLVNRLGIPYGYVMEQLYSFYI